MKVQVGSDFEKSLRRFKRIVDIDGTLRDLKERKRHIKRGEKRRPKHHRHMMRTRKNGRKDE